MKQVLSIPQSIIGEKITLQLILVSPFFAQNYLVNLSHITKEGKLVDGL